MIEVPSLKRTQTKKFGAFSRQKFALKMHRKVLETVFLLEQKLGRPVWIREIYHAIEFGWLLIAPPLVRFYAIFMATLDLYSDD
jgi:hypothetical protein